jgi:hypothetical protein
MAPNAGHQARLEAGAERTLEAVACMPSLGLAAALAVCVIKQNYLQVTVFELIVMPVKESYA